jgi:hypothetical protein
VITKASFTKIDLTLEIRIGGFMKFRWMLLTASITVALASCGSSNLPKNASSALLPDPIDCTTALARSVDPRCGGGGGGGGGTVDDQPILGDQVVLAPTTKIVSADQFAALEDVQNDGSTLVFPNSAGIADTFAVGNTVSIEASKEAPKGALLKVTAVREVGDKLYADVEQGALEEAVQDGDLIERAALDPVNIVEETSDLAGIETARRSTRSPLSVGGTFTDVELCKDALGNKILLNGQYHADFDMWLRIKIRRLRLEKFEAGYEANENTNINVSGECHDLSFQKEWVLKTYTFKEFKFKIGPVGVYVTPKIFLILGAKGKITAKAVFEAKHDFHVLRGVQYFRGQGWSKLRETENDLTGDVTTLEGDAVARGYVGAKVGFEFWGGIGRIKLASGNVYLYPKVFAEIEASVNIPAQIYQWCLYGGVNASLSGQLKVLGFNILNGSIELGEWRRLVKCNGHKGMTWAVLNQNNNVTLVGSDTQTNPYKGDTAPSAFRPLLCLYQDGRAVPAGLVTGFYNGWAQGEARVAESVAGQNLKSRAIADARCANRFGAGWRMGEFHDGTYSGGNGGWAWYANGQINRFWVAINDQPANPWNGGGKAMTWTTIGQNNDVAHVGGDTQTNAYNGDTSISATLPMLCIKQDGRAVPAGVTPDFYNGWAKGEIRLTESIQGTNLTSRAAADGVCADRFGAAWRMAEFHDGNGGWTWYANGQVNRFWTAINDQAANPWN